MKITENAFDRNLALFDASSTLTHFRQRATSSGKTPLQEICTDDWKEARRFFPRLYRALELHLRPKDHLHLWFWALSDQDRNQWRDYSVNGPCRIAVIMAKNTFLAPPGSLIELSAEEDLFLPYNDLKYGFLALFNHGPVKRLEM